MSVLDRFSLRDHVIVVTGGLGQLGRSFTRALGEAGARVAVLDVAEERENGRRGEGESRHGTAETGVSLPPPHPTSPSPLHIVADVTSGDSLREALATIERELGTPTGLVNNAALDSPPDAPTSETGPFETYPEESWDRVMEVNAKGAFLCCQAFGGRMAEAGRGSIVNVCSIYGVVSPNQRMYEYRREESGEPFFKPVAYAASKSSLLNLTRYLATYWAPRVRVNTVTFGGVFNEQDDRFLAEYESRVPMGRMAREHEYDATLVYLLSDASSYVTGSNLVADGGWTAW